MLPAGGSLSSLSSSLSKLKDSKREMAQRLKASIDRNSQLYQHHSASARRFSQKVIVGREQSIQLLQKKLTHKLRTDEMNGARLQRAQEEAIRRRQELQRMMEEIGTRNAQRLMELQAAEQQVINRIQKDLQRSEAREKHLRAEYVRLQKEEDSVGATRKFQKKQAVEQWRLLQAEKWRIEALARESEQRQNILVQEKKPVPTRKEQKKKEQRYIPTQKEYNRLKAPTALDSKQMGNQYLQQAKLLYREHVLKNKKKNLMNVNLKVINYAAEIMDKISRNTSDLSKLRNTHPLPPAASYPPKEQVPPVMILPVTQQPKQKQEVKLQEDLETERYLKLIKSNLQQLEKANPEGIMP